VRWRSPERADAQTAWSQALRRHGLHTAIGIAWATLVWWLAPDFLAWLLPVVGPMVLSIPLSVCTSRIDSGKALRRHGLLLTPEETATPAVLSTMRTCLRRPTVPVRLNARATDAIVGAIKTRDAGAPAVH
jgi:membrane glycosyltransferase